MLGAYQYYQTMIRSKWFDRRRQTMREHMQVGDGCMAGIVFLLLTCMLIFGIVILVQIGAL